MNDSNSIFIPSPTLINLLSVSYLLYTLIGFVITWLIGLSVSWMTSSRSDRPVDSKLIFNLQKLLKRKSVKVSNNNLKERHCKQHKFLLFQTELNTACVLNTME